MAGPGAGGAAWPVYVDGHVVTHGLDVPLSETEILLHSFTLMIINNLPLMPGAFTNVVQ